MKNIELKINSDKKFVLIVQEDNPERFSDCCVKYIDNGNEIVLFNWDFFYVFVEEIYIGSQHIYSLENADNLFGKIGQFQECYLFSDEFNENHKNEIYCLEKSWLLSSSTHGVFLYRFSGSIWLEIDVGYENNPDVDEDLISPEEFYSDFRNYRILLTELSNETINEWQRILKPYYDIVRIKNNIEKT